MPQPDLQTQTIRDENGNFVCWRKVCPRCHKTFETTSRRQKFCCNDCAVKYNKKQKEQKERYSRVKEVERLRVRAHSLAKSVIDDLVSRGLRVWECECCGSKEGLQIHHANHFNWLDNTPANLKILCKKCHSKEHSRIEKELNEQGILVEEWYEPSMQPYHNLLNK